ncbi:hypothetical protein BASA81_014013 [Batrachochytrium salamandrivorans]|nr:hypothetical protein BASA81_014013 [Batrachochytrium salamandrivorans]
MGFDSDYEDDVEEEEEFVPKRARQQEKKPDLEAELPTSRKLPLIEKYRPATLDDVVAQDDIIQTITKLMDKKALPHLLLYGPPGTGKTSTILALARKLFGTNQLSSMVLELNASDSRGIDDVRDSIVTFASTRKIFSSGMKLVILDEADNMTKDAQFALRRVIEKYTANTRFCLICNYVSKIIPALQSRCTKFRFSPLVPELVKSRVFDICEMEKITLTKDGMEALLRLSKGDMRKVLNLLEASAMQQQQECITVDYALVYQVAGKPTPQDVDMVLELLMNETSIQQQYYMLHQLQVDKSLALLDICLELHDRVVGLELPNDLVKFLLAQLAELEFRLATAVDDKIQLHGLIAVFVLARHKIASGL